MHPAFNLNLPSQTLFSITKPRWQIQPVNSRQYWFASHGWVHRDGSWQRLNDPDTNSNSSMQRHPCSPLSSIVQSALVQLVVHWSAKNSLNVKW